MINYIQYPLKMLSGRAKWGGSRSRVSDMQIALRPSWVQIGRISHESGLSMTFAQGAPSSALSK